MFNSFKDSLDVITGTEDGRTSVGGARWACALFTVGTLIIGSKWTRARVRDRKDPILGLIG